MDKYILAVLGTLCCFLVGYAGKDSAGSGLTLEFVQDYDTVKSAGSQSPVSLPDPDDFVKGFYIYDSTGSAKNHFVPSGWMGDYGDVRYDDSYIGNCRVTNKCIQFVYTAARSQGYGWAGVYWQHPVQNWGNEPGGYNLMGMRRLTFWARGEHGGERIERFMVGGIAGLYSDSVKTWLGPVVLSHEWTKYAIDLSNYSLAHISGGFSWFIEYSSNRDGCTFYLDEIKFESDGRHSGGYSSPSIPVTSGK